MRQKGFTIVELLVVIVIIGVLSSLVISAYNGIQQTARNSAIKSGVAAYHKALTKYAIEHGSYPGVVNACLGANYPDGKCYQWAPSGSYSVSAVMDTALRPYIGSNKPTLTTRLMIYYSAGPDRRGGALFTTSPYRISYYLEGLNQKCINGTVGTGSVEASACEINLQDPTTF